ncbi:MAG: alpha/beta hydrolase [Symploca sp. SIO3C6]|uniref:Alpha/beta hydrolase n=1 Tax=Symploca sp. SIO1C4 TaxID=2607765 RepID=A0A6B3NB28_9CYAN|nr:alpha/beta hydrolase [Symploca sp. SIO3C6]NER26851.1 alpha/beta hydrolase [Symploca sp. SIO1C4]
MTETPDFILYAQHGWADNHKAIAKLTKRLNVSKARIITPNLGWIRTWLRIEPLIEQVEQKAIETIAAYPNTPMRIIGHSMGGLIWLEILSRHPEWHPKVESLVLIASPVGGADLARIIDPLGIGIGIARDLGKNRRQIAQSIAKNIPTLAIAGDQDQGSDGTITLEATKFEGAKLVVLPSLRHPELKNHCQVATNIINFWANPVITAPPPIDFAYKLIERLRLVPGMTDAHQRDFHRAKTYLRFDNGLTIRTWKHPLQMEHVFVANGKEQCLYSGFVGWMHFRELHQVLEEITREFN